MNEENEYDVSWSNYIYSENPINAVRQAQDQVRDGIAYGTGATVWVVRNTVTKEKWVIDMDDLLNPQFIQGRPVSETEEE